MRKTIYSAAVVWAMIAALALPLAAGKPKPPKKKKEPLLGRLFHPAGARIVVREEECTCDSLDGKPDLLLLTVGSERTGRQDPQFHPLATFAFDRSLSDEEPGHWLGFWTYGPSAGGPGRNLAAWTPVPVGSPGISKRRLKKLEASLEKLRAGDLPQQPDIPRTFLDLTQAGRFPRTRRMTGGLKRVLGWIDLFTPVQFVYRSYLTQRRDRRERQFQRAMISLYWLLDSEAYRHKGREWLETMKDVKFHLIRTRSIWGSFISAADAWDLVLGHEGSVREYHSKNSAWMQVAANEHFLRYEPIYRLTENGRGSPMAGVLYYDPRIADAHDPGWWDVSNPFDLTYNPHKNRKVQRLAKEHPGELIPLAVYTFQTDLGLRPIITIDFFDPGNPRTRERNQYLINYLGHWLSIETGALSLQRLPYRGATWAANKKGLTLLTNLSSRLGVEELRMSLEAGLYFRPDALEEMLGQADQRSLNPLVHPAAEERVRAVLQYESLRANKFRGFCLEASRIRRTMMERIGISPKTGRVERRQRLARYLLDRRHMGQLRTLRRRLTRDYGTMERLAEPLDYFEAAEGPFPRSLHRVLARTYEELREAELTLPENHGLPELIVLKERTLAVWKRVSEIRGVPDFDARLARRERRAQRYLARRQKKARRQQARQLRRLLEESRVELKKAARAGCDPDRYSPADVEAYLVLLREVVRAAPESVLLQAELDRQKFDLTLAVERVEAQYARCSIAEDDLWRAQRRDTGRELARSLLAVLNGPGTDAAAGGGN